MKSNKDDLIILEAYIDGIYCSACVNKIQKKVSKLPFVKDIKINTLNNNAKIYLDKDKADIDAIQKTIEQLGYKALFKSSRISSIDKKKFFNINFLLQIIFAFLVIAIEMFGSNQFIEKFIDLLPIKKSLFLFLTTLTVIILGGLDYYKKFFLSLKSLSFDMSALVTIGTLSAFVYSSYFAALDILNLKVLPHTFFDSAVAIITLVNLGKKIEEKVKFESISSFNILKKILPDKAFVYKDNREIETPIDNIKKGDIVILKPGDISPVDGKIIDGYADFDESFITGESLPVGKKIEDFVYAGSINLDGYVRIIVQSPANFSFISEIINSAEDITLSKANIQRVADKIASIFVPIILFVSISAFFIHILIENNLELALLAFISTLIISCPCAFGIAAPTAIAAGFGLAAKNLIIFKTPLAFETFPKINIIFFDKTGSLTEGNSKINKVIYNPEISKDIIDTLAYSVSSTTSHPFSRSIFNYYLDLNLNLKKIKIEEFQYFVSKGGVYKIDDELFYFGKKEFLIENGVPISFEESDLSYCSKVYLGTKEKLYAIFCISDELKPRAFETIDFFKKQGIKTCVLSGDEPQIVENVSRSLSVDQFFSRLTPIQKKEIIEKAKKEGYITAMVGDGINDSVALTIADVSISFSKASNAAINYANALIIGSDIKKIFIAYQISKATLKVIKQNFFWAFVYNIAFVPTAAIGLLHPMYAAAAMSFSSISVVLNSLRLKFMNLSK